MSLSLCGSDFDNLLYVVDASQTPIGDKCNDDSDRDGCDGDAFLTLDVDPFTAYYVIVDGYGTENGEFRLQVSPGVCWLGPWIESALMMMMMMMMVVVVAAVAGVSDRGALG